LVTLKTKAKAGKKEEKKKDPANDKKPESKDD
jgi:hypothetical protein